MLLDTPNQPLIYFFYSSKVLLQAVRFPMNSSELPYSIGRYQVTQKLGRGGMGIVYLAYDPFIDRMVAVKVASTVSVQDESRLEEFRREFLNEARAAGKLLHPHIVSVYDAAVENNRCYLVMEYVDGPTLKKFCRKDTLLPIEEVVKISYQCAKALDYAHENGVIHRDIKPGNIMLSSRGEVKIADFGIALIGDPADLNSSGSLTGSASYTSPEQLRDEVITPQADLFSLGVVMFELLAGKNPFEADSDVATVYRITHDDPQPLRSLRPDIPGTLEAIVHRALEKDLKERYATAGEIATDLGNAFKHIRLPEEGVNLEKKFNALKRIDFFRDFNSMELSEILKDTQWLEYGASSTILTEGEKEDAFYIIVAGEVVVRKMGKAIAVLKQGDCFGEMACLGKVRRTASIEALTDTILMKINASIIDKTPMATQLRFYKVFTGTLIRRLAQTSRLLSQASP
ncbi:MAG: protein kinase [Deltaproteobacteria bacterium]|nr:protein kinase [Deltaproteobacteria bacterium]MBW2018039.1 protein kinase [Deltaproteobacteria bacterium]